MSELVSALNKIEGGRAAEALKLLNEFAADTQSLSVDCQDMAGFVVFVWDDTGTFHSAFSNGVRSPYSKELAGILLAKKIEHLFFRED